MSGGPTKREGLGAPPPPSDQDRRSSPWVHAFGVAWMALLALAVLAPALSHGSSFGSYDVLSQFGVLRQHGVVIHNLQAGDQSDQIIPWTTLAWTQVHHGHLPLWNPYEGLGMPLAFNWQTVAFSVPSLISYLFPLTLSYTVQVVVTLVIAGTGMYTLARVLRLGTLASLFAGTVFELSGPMLGWLGWPHAAVLSWSGWLFAAALLVVRGRRRVPSIALVALIIAAMVYAGQAEILTLAGLALLVFLVVLFIQRTAPLSGSGPIRRPVLDLSIAAVAGGALGAPLLLPGLQVISISERGVPGGDPGELIKGNPPLPAHNLVHLLFQGFDGLPVAGNHWFGYPNGYSESAAYVGIIALVMAVVAVGVRRRRPEVVSFAALAAVMVAVAFVPVVVSGLDKLPLIGTVLWQRAILLLAFSLSVLAGVGVDAVVRDYRLRSVRRWTAGGFGAAALGLIALWLFGRGHLDPSDAAIRARSFVWPLIETVLGLVLAGVLVLTHRRHREREGLEDRQGVDVGRIAGVALLACETAFLVTAGAPLWTSSTTPFVTTPAMAALKSSVGTSTVALGLPYCFLPPGLGIPENAQIAYGVQELALYDPMIPSAYYSAWDANGHGSAGIPADSVYCPGVNTASLARLYGVGFVIEPAGAPGPQGGVYDRTLGDDTLYRIPGAAAATLSPLAPDGGLPATEAPGTPVAVTHSSPSVWQLTTSSTEPQVLRLRLTDVPGWHASIDGQAVPLHQFAGVMLQVKVPAGRHTVVLRYWPSSFTAGIALAACAAIGLLAALVVDHRRRRRRLTPGETDGIGPNLPTDTRASGVSR
jgi:hypothetical protein